MKKYLQENKPNFTIWLIVLFLISSLLTAFSYRFGQFLLLYPSNIQEPVQWYRLLTYPFYIDGLFFWFFNAVAWYLAALLFENKIPRKAMLILTVMSVVIGGLVFTLLNQEKSLMSLGSPVMITWGYIAVTLVYGFKFRKTLITYEKIIVILALLTMVSLFLPHNHGIFLPQLAVIVSVGLYVWVSIKFDKR